MGRVVVDSSAIVEFLRAGRDPSPFDEVFTAGADLHVPEVCDVEIVSAFRRPVLAGELAPATMHLLLIDYAEMAIRRHRHLPLVGRAFELRDHLTAADAMYVALAERLGAALATADVALGRAARAYTSLEVVP